jgi:hypothetical protein
VLGALGNEAKHTFGMMQELGLVARFEMTIVE